MSPAIAYFSSVRQNNTYWRLDNFEKYLGFSRGAYQVRVLSAMIDKVRYFLSSQAPEVMSPENDRLASSIREMRRRFHCTFQIILPFLSPDRSYSVHTNCIPTRTAICSQWLQLDRQRKK